MRFDSMLESYVWNSTATRHELGCDRAQIPRCRADSATRTSPARARSRSHSARCRSTLRRATSREADRCRPCTLHRTLWPKLAADAGAAVAVREHRAAARARAVAHGAGRRADRRRAAAAAERRAGARMRELEAQAHAGRRRTVRARVAEAAAGSAVRQAGAAGVAQDADRPTVDGRRRARGARGQIRAAALDHGLPRVREAQVDLHRQAAAADQSRHRPRPHVLSAGDRRDRDGCRPAIRTCRTFRSARPKAGASARRSSRRRAGASSPPTIRRSSCASWRICRATPAC